MVEDPQLEMHLAKVIDHETRGPEKRLLIMALAIGMALLIGLAFSTIVLNARVSDTIKEVRHTQSKIKDTLDYQTQCNTPGDKPPPNTGHKCFDDTNNRVGVYITTIDKVTVAADECGRRLHGETSDVQFEECIKGKLSGPIP